MFLVSGFGFRVIWKIWLYPYSKCIIAYIKRINDHGISIFFECIFSVLNSEQWHLELFRRGRSHPAWVRVSGNPPSGYEISPACHTRAAVAITCFVFVFVFEWVPSSSFFSVGGGGLYMPIFFIAFLRMKNSKSEIRRLHDLHAYTVAPSYMSEINPPAPCKPTCRTPLFYHFRKIQIAWKKSWRHLYIWLFSQSMISWYKQKANWHVEFTMFTCFKTFNYCI